MRPRPLTSDLIAILGEEAFLRLAEELGGTRAYIPPVLRPDSAIVQAIGMEAANKLARIYAPTAIRVPLARRERARALRGKGLSNAQIARKLGMTETGVEKLFDREQDSTDGPACGRKTAQLPLFGD